MVTEITPRDHIISVCADLTSERDHLDPTGAAWLAKDAELDMALAELFSLGPDPAHVREDS